MMTKEEMLQQVLEYFCATIEATGGSTPRGTPWRMRTGSTSGTATRMPARSSGGSSCKR